MFSDFHSYCNDYQEYVVLLRITIIVSLWQHAIPLAQQVQYYKEYQSKVETIAGREKARTLFNGSIYILSAGNSDFIQNYYVNPMLSGTYTPDQFSELLAKSFTNFVQVHSLQNFTKLL